MSERRVEIGLFKILELVSCAEDYGFAKPMLLSALAEMTGSVSDEEVSEYARRFLSEENLALGYGQEDVDSVMDRLNSWREEYFEASHE